MIRASGLIIDSYQLSSKYIQRTFHFETGLVIPLDIHNSTHYTGSKSRNGESV